MLLVVDQLVEYMPKRVAPVSRMGIKMAWVDVVSHSTIQLSVLTPFLCPLPDHQKPKAHCMQSAAFFFSFHAMVCSRVIRRNSICTTVCVQNTGPALQWPYELGWTKVGVEVVATKQR